MTFRTFEPLTVLLLALCAAGNWIETADAAEPASNRMGFFVSSRSPGNGGNLGGLQGADRHCQLLASEAGVGDRTWHAYLSTAPDASTARVDARDRVGAGPWANAKGVVIARTLEDLHSDRNRIDRFTALDERGREIPGIKHAILTGSDKSGRLAFTQSVPATCGNWTLNRGSFARLGHHDRYRAEGSEDTLAHFDESWISRHDSRSCSEEDLPKTGSGGLIYCFAADAPKHATPAAPEDSKTYTYRRGVNLNHWLGDNLAASVAPNSLYAEPWFNQEDVDWIALQGFDHLRIHVNGGKWVTKEGDLDAAAIAPFENALRWANARGMGVVLTMTGLPRFRSGLRGEKVPGAASPFSDVTTRGHASYLWWMVARHFADAGAGLRFELINAPDTKVASELRSFNSEMLAAIRRTNPTRVVYVTSLGMEIDKSETVDLSDPNTALAVTFMEPELFTWQMDPERPKVEFPGSVPDLSKFATEDDLIPRLLSGASIGPELLKARMDVLGSRMKEEFGTREVYISTLSVFQGVEDKAARAYLSAAKAAIEAQGFSWAVYDYNTGGAIRGEDGKPTRVIEALGMGAPEKAKPAVHSH